MKGDSTGKCPVCGSGTRLLYQMGKGSGHVRNQHTRWHICEKGHKLYKKRGQ